MGTDYSQVTALGERCMGCGVCAAVCPEGVLGFAPDAEGFYRPFAEAAERCTACGICWRSCAAMGCGERSEPQGRAVATRASAGRRGSPATAVGEISEARCSPPRGVAADCGVRKANPMRRTRASDADVLVSGESLNKIPDLSSRAKHLVANIASRAKNGSGTRGFLRKPQGGPSARGLCSTQSPVASGAGPHTKLAERDLVTFAAWSDDGAARLACSSGGVAYELAREVVDGGGAFCGVRYNAAARKAEHYVGNPEASRGSKYLQSDSVVGFREILECSPPRGEPADCGLSQKAQKIITGTPCQIASLRNYLNIRKTGERFLLVDFFCHGVPSLDLWHKYLDENPALAGADEVNMRDKSLGWHDSWRIRGTARDGATLWFSERHDMFYTFFLRNYVSQRACYECPFRLGNSAADVRVGDLWGGAYADDEQGVSAAVAMTAKGLAALRGLKNVTLTECDFATATAGQVRGDVRVPRLHGRLLAELRGPRTLAQIYRKYEWRLRLGRRWGSVWCAFRSQ